jgi:hypothetical protein
LKKVDEQLTSKQNHHQLFIQKHKNTQHTQRQTQKRNTAIRKRNTNTPYTNTHIERNTAARKRNTNTHPTQTDTQTDRNKKKHIFTDENYKNRKKYIHLHGRKTQTHPHTNRHTDRQERKNIKT